MYKLLLEIPELDKLLWELEDWVRAGQLLRELNALVFRCVCDVSPPKIRSGQACQIVGHHPGQQLPVGQPGVVSRTEQHLLVPQQYPTVLFR